MFINWWRVQEIIVISFNGFMVCLYQYHPLVAQLWEGNPLLLDL